MIEAGNHRSGWRGCVEGQGRPVSSQRLLQRSPATENQEPATSLSIMNQQQAYQ